MRISSLLGAVLLSGALLRVGLPAQAADEAAGAPMLTRIGIVPLRDDSDQPRLAASLGKLLRSRLAARFKGVEFIAVDPALLDNGYNGGPLLLDEAVELGRRADVDALLDGVFGGVKIAGGSWPSLTSSAPEARGKLRWRLVECREGLLLSDGTINPDRNKAYSQRIRTEKELEQRVLQDLALAVGDELEKLGRLPEKKGALAPAPPPMRKGDSEAEEAEPISLTGEPEQDAETAADEDSAQEGSRDGME